MRYQISYKNINTSNRMDNKSKTGCVLDLLSVSDHFREGRQCLGK